ncbi:MAG: DUF4430 domain-containing protein [Minisyncoccia bacterium]
MNKKIKFILITIFALYFAFFGLSLIKPSISQKEAVAPSPTSPATENPIQTNNSQGAESVKTVLLINDIRYEGIIASKESVYDFMSMLRNEGKINFIEKSYSGMGMFIVSINGIKGGADRSWIYYVNDKEAGIGVSNYKINPGDVVSWKYEKSIY